MFYSVVPTFSFAKKCVLLHPLSSWVLFYSDSMQTYCDDEIASERHVLSLKFIIAQGTVLWEWVNSKGKIILCSLLCTHPLCKLSLYLYQSSVILAFKNLCAFM